MGKGMMKRTLKEWIEAMKLCMDNDIAFSVSGPGLRDLTNLLEDYREETIELMQENQELKRKDKVR